jgi:hypothetical protein
MNAVAINAKSLAGIFLASRIRTKMSAAATVIRAARTIGDSSDWLILTVDQT